MSILRKIIFCAWFLLSLLNSGYSQRYAMQFQQCYGGSDQDWVVDFCIQEDSSYIILATTRSTDGDVSFLHGESDFWLVHVDRMGSLIWEKTLGGSNIEDPKSISMTSDGDILIFGDTESNDGDVSGNHGGFDFWVVRTDVSGNIIWENCIGSSVNDLAGAMTVDSLDNIYTIGSSHGTDGDITSNNGLIDIWVAKLDSSGNLLQQKSFGGEGFDYGACISLTDDGGCIFGGIVMSNYGDVECDGPTYNQADIWVVKLDSLFNIQWKKCYGGSFHESVIDILVLDDSGFLLTGNTNSNDGDISGFHGVPGGDYHDIWVIKIDSVGNIEWQQCLGGTKQEYSTSSTILYNGEFLVNGVTSSHDGDVVGNHSANFAFDIWLVGIDTDGSFVWQQCFGSSNLNSSSHMFLVNELEIFTGGSASYSDGSVDCDIYHPSPPLDTDLWLFQIIDTVTVNYNELDEEPLTISLYPNPVQDVMYYHIYPPQDNLTLRLYDIYGQKMDELFLSRKESQVKIEVSDYHPGVYVAVLFSDSRIIDRRQFIVK